MVKSLAEQIQEVDMKIRFLEVSIPLCVEDLKAPFSSLN